MPTVPTDRALPGDQPLPLTGTDLQVYARRDNTFETAIERNLTIEDGRLDAVAVLASGGTEANPQIGLLVRRPDSTQVLARITLGDLLEIIKQIRDAQAT